MLLAAAASVSAMAADTWSLQGTTFTVDTLFHNQVGPGTTSTSLWFRNPANGDALRVFYATMDLTNPYLKLRGVCATDKVKSFPIVFIHWIFNRDNWIFIY